MRSLSLAAEHYESGERLGRAVLNHGCYYCLSYRGQGQKVCFDIARFDAVTAELELRIHPALKKKETVMKPALVASSISASTEMIKEDGFGKVGASKITEANIRPRDDNFALLVCWQSFASSIHNENVGPRHRASHWQRRILF